MSLLHIKSLTLRKLCGLFLIILFLLPYGKVDSASKDLKHVLSAYEWFLSTFIIFAVSWVFCLLVKHEFRIPEFLTRIFKPFVLVIFALALSQLFGYFSFEFRPHLIDAVVQLWQAKVLSEGEIYARYNGPVSFIVMQNILYEGGKLYSQYPPGNSIILALNYLSGIPNLSGALLSFLTIFSIYRFTLMEYGNNAGIISLCLCCFCSFFLFNSQSYMNHVPGLAFTAVFLNYFSIWLRSNSTGSLLIIAVSLGCVFISRPLEGAFLFLFFIIFSLTNLSDLRKSKLLVNAISFSFVFSIISSIYFLYNKFTTGSFLLPGYIKLWGSGHGLGFHESPWGVEHTFSKGLYSFYINLKLLNEYLFESPLPPLTILGLYFLLKKEKFSAWDKKLFLISLGIPFIYIFYWHRDSFLGPRYTYIALAAFIPLFSSALLGLYNLTEKIHFTPVRGILRAISIRNFYFFCILFSVLYIITIGMPMRAIEYSSSFQSMKIDITEELKAKKISEGIVFVKVGWGTRLISSLRGLGVPAALTEKAYRSIDHCELSLLIKNFNQNNPGLEEIVKRLQMLIGENQVLVKPALNWDPSLRLAPGRALEVSCQDEILYDKAGYSLFEPHFLVNNVDFSGKLIIVKDLRDENFKFTSRYPDIKKHYIWSENQLEELHF